MKVTKVRNLSTMKQNKTGKRELNKKVEGGFFFIPRHVALQIAQSLKCEAAVPGGSSDLTLQSVLDAAFCNGELPCQVHIEA